MIFRHTFLYIGSTVFLGIMLFLPSYATENNIELDQATTENVLPIVAESSLKKFTKSLVNVTKSVKTERQLHFLDTIPEKYADSYQILYPNINTVTLKPSLQLKGKTRYLMPVFINNTLVQPRNDGRFFHKINFDQYRGYPVVITFITPDFQPLSVVRKIYHLASPPEDIKFFKKDRKTIIHYLNTGYANEKLRLRNLKDKFTRADLAWFIATLKNNSEQTVKIPVFQDVPADHWAASAIQYTIDSAILSEYPDGKFHPEKPIKRIEYIISITRAFRYDLVKTNPKLPFKDVNSNHWTAKYIQTAYSNGILAKSALLYPDHILSIADFIGHAKQIEDVKNALQKIQKFDQHLTISEQQIDQLKAVIFPAIAKVKLDLIKKQTLLVDVPTSNQIHFEPVVQIQGKVFPPTDIQINDQLIVPSLDGHFSATFNASEPINKFTIKALGKTVKRTTQFVPPYSDLDKHWLSQTAAKCRYLQLTEQTDTFLPKTTITKADLAHFLTQFFNIELLENTTSNLKDLTPETPHYEDVLAVVNLGILRGDQHQNIYPEKLTTKIEAIVAVTRLALKMEQISPTFDAQAKLPFRDIHSRHWAKDELRIALQNKLISSRSRLYPKQVINKAQLIALLCKTPYIKSKFKQTFDHD